MEKPKKVEQSITHHYSFLQEDVVSTTEFDALKAGFFHFWLEAPLAGPQKKLEDDDDEEEEEEGEENEEVQPWCNHVSLPPFTLLFLFYLELSFYTLILRSCCCVLLWASPVFGVLFLKYVEVIEQQRASTIAARIVSIDDQ